MVQVPEYNLVKERFDKIESALTPVPFKNFEEFKKYAGLLKEGDIVIISSMEHKASSSKDDMISITGGVYTVSSVVENGYIVLSGSSTGSFKGTISGGTWVDSIINSHLISISTPVSGYISFQAMASSRFVYYSRDFSDPKYLKNEWEGYFIFHSRAWSTEQSV